MKPNADVQGDLSALDAFTRVVASEVVGDGVTFTTIHMPLVRTPMIAPTGIYRNFPTIDTDQAAEMVMQALITRPPEVSTRKRPSACRSTTFTC